MTLEEAIAEVKYWHERGRYWPGAHEPATVAEVIITAAASGDLIPLVALKTVLDREAAAYARHDKKVEELEETIEDYRSEIYWMKDRYDV